MTTFNIKTLGCKVNQYESDSLAEYLVKKGLTHIKTGNNTDICIINTCAVTAKASMQSRQAIRKIIRQNPTARIIVTGCYSQIEKDEILTIEGVDDIVPHDDKQLIPEIILSGKDSFKVSMLTETKRSFEEYACNATIFREMPLTSPGKRTRPFLKIQDGCNSFCSYCIVPYTRGRSRSMDPDVVLKKIKKLSESGYKEIVLTGIHLGAFGLDLTPQTNLFELLEKITEKKLVNRLRLSSLEPREITDNLIKLVSTSEMICNHFHVPVQSADDRILKEMNRPYTASFLDKRIRNIHDQMPDAGIGTDILTGFPGETEKEFQQTYDLIKSLPVTYFHVFPFSPRKGTKAYGLKNKIDPDTLKERSRLLRELGNEKKRGFYKRMIDQPLEILVENERDRQTGYLKGISSNYVRVLIDDLDILKNTLQIVTVKKIVDDSSVFGERVI